MNHLSMHRPRRILFVTPPIGPIGGGLCGGVETSLLQLTHELTRRGHAIGTVAIRGSRGLAGALFEAGGRCPSSVTHRGRTHVDTVDSGGALEQMWERASRLQDAYDVILNTGYDWLSFYVPAFLGIPVLHWISVCSLNDAVDRMLEIRYRQHPSRFAFYSRTQAATFPFVRAETAHILYGGVDTGVFEFDPQPERRMCWSARISPEKGLEDALDVCRELSLPLDVCGKIEDQDYWQSLQRRMDSDAVCYRGFLSPPELSRVLGRSMAMLVTPKWNEAFGVSLIEAMSCGTPVAAYAGGGPSGIVQHGENGYLVERGDIGALAQHALLAAELDRGKVRARAAQFGVAALADRVEEWIDAAVKPLAAAGGSA
jgi:UDP-glucose:tetrahydrobiopterin glucosyltransferase